VRKLDWMTSTVRLGLAGDSYERGRPLSRYEQRDLVPRDHGDVLDERVLMTRTSSPFSAARGQGGRNGRGARKGVVVGVPKACPRPRERTQRTFGTRG
jgi:hypothetical protein